MGVGGLRHLEYGLCGSADREMGRLSPSQEGPLLFTVSQTVLYLVVPVSMCPGVYRNKVCALYRPIVRAIVGFHQLGPKDTDPLMA